LIDEGAVLLEGGDGIVFVGELGLELGYLTQGVFVFGGYGVELLGEGEDLIGEAFDVGLSRGLDAEEGEDCEEEEDGEGEEEFAEFGGAEDAVVCVCVVVRGVG